MIFLFGSKFSPLLQFEMWTLDSCIRRFSLPVPFPAMAAAAAAAAEDEEDAAEHERELLSLKI